jgi:7-cyano-7-deazaguanine synthase in queuosine biosynthesis
MIYEFKSRATGSVIMTNDIAQAVLTIIGKSPAAQGIIVPDAMPAAIEALQQAVAAQQASEKTIPQPSIASDKEPTISLGQRAFPFIEMMQRAHAAGKEITWGV